jgi:hypothetical protein
MRFHLQSNGGTQIEETSSGWKRWQEQAFGAAWNGRTSNGVLTCFRQGNLILQVCNAFIALVFDGQRRDKLSSPFSQLVLPSLEFAPSRKAA